MPHSLYLFLIQAIISLRELFPDHYGHVCNGNLVYIPICMYALFLSKRVTWSIYLRGGIRYYTDEKGEEVLYALTVHRHAQRLNVAAIVCGCGWMARGRLPTFAREKNGVVTRCACTIAVIACLRVCVCVCVCVQIAVIACVQSLVRFLPVISCALIAVVAFV